MLLLGFAIVETDFGGYATQIGYIRPFAYKLFVVVRCKHGFGVDIVHVISALLHLHRWERIGAFAPPVRRGYTG